MLYPLMMVALFSVTANPDLTLSAPSRHASLLGTEPHPRVEPGRELLLEGKPPVAGWAVMAGAGIVTGVGFLGVCGLFTWIVAGSDSLSSFGLLIIVGTGLLGSGAVLVAVLGMVSLLRAIAEREKYGRELERLQRERDIGPLSAPPRVDSGGSPPGWVLATF